MAAPDPRVPTKLLPSGVLLVIYTAEEALAVPAKGSSIHGNPEGLGTPTPKDYGSLASSRRPRSPVMSGAIREVSSSSRHSASSLRHKTSVTRRTKSSPETGQHESVRVGPRLIRRKGVSADVEAADDSDMRDDFDPRSAGLASPPAIGSRDLGSGLNLEPKAKPALNFNTRHSQTQRSLGPTLTLRNSSAEVQKKGLCN